MIIVAYLVALHAVLSLAALGISITLLKRTPWLPLAPLVAAATWPTWVVVVLSACGYIGASRFSVPAALVLVAIGLIWTAFEVKRHGIPQFHLAGHAIALLAGLVVVAPHVWNNDFGYFEFGNGEFINYGQLASYSMGLYHDALSVAWTAGHQNARDGVDFINALVANLTRYDPVHIVQLTSALLRSAYLSALIAVIFAVLPSRAIGVGIAALVAVSAMDLIQFDVSFMGSSLAASMIVCTAAIVVGSKLVPPLIFLVAYFVLNIALLVSYPEGMAMQKLLEVIYVAERFFFRKDKELLIRWAIGNALVCVANPLLVFAKITYVKAIMGSENGWNFVAPGIIQYVRRMIGIEPLYVTALALYTSISAFAVTAALLTSFTVILNLHFAKQLRSSVPIVILAIIIGLHARPYLTGGSHYYSATKILLAWWWLLPVAIAVAVARHRRYAALILALPALLLVANAETLRRGLSHRFQLPFNSATEANRMVKALTGKVVAIDSDDGIPILYWHQVLDNHGIATSLSHEQAKMVSRNPALSPQPIPTDVTVIRPKTSLNFEPSRTDLVLTVR